MKKTLTKVGQVLLVVLAIPVILYGMVFTLSIANAAQAKENICHATGSESNPWEAISINDNQNNHDDHEKDFPYNGPVKENGQPVNDKSISDAWCADNAPVVTPEDPKTCPEGTVNIGTEQEPECRDEPTGCPYGDSIPVDSPKCVAPQDEVENTTPTPVETQDTEIFQGK
jgi:hypothetical protein